MTGHKPRPLVYAAGGAGATVALVALAVLLSTQGLETASKVAGIISMFVGISSLSVAIWNALRAKQAQREKVASGEDARGIEASPAKPPAPITGSEVKVGRVRAQNVAIGDNNENHFGSAGRSERDNATKERKRKR
jgi:hypothetical protein